MRWKAGAFTLQSKKIKKQGREKYKIIFLAGATLSTLFGVRKNKEIIVKTNIGLVFQGLAD